MTDTTLRRRPPRTPVWYGLSSDLVAQRVGVDPAVGLSSAEAASRLATNGPNELPAEKPVPGGDSSWTSTGTTCS